MEGSVSLRDARDFSPIDFRRWVIGGVSLAVAGYLVVLLTRLVQFGYEPGNTPRLVAITVVSTGALLLALRHRELAAALLSIAATWIEIQLGFLANTDAVGPGMLVMPVVMIALGLLLGARPALVMMIVSIIATVITHRLSAANRAGGLTPEVGNWLVMFSIAMVTAWAFLYLSLGGFAQLFDRLRAKQQDLADTIRFAPEGMLVLDAGGVVSIVNPAAEAILGIPAHRIIAQPLAHVMAEATGTGDASALRFDERGDVPVAVQWTARDGTVMCVEVTWRSMEGSRRVVLLRNVTERWHSERARQAMEAQAAEAERRETVGQLAGGLSHDFNNILTAVGALAELMRTEDDARPRAVLADELLMARDRGAMLTRQLLAFARRDVAQPRTLDLSQLLAELAPRLEQRLRARQRLDVTGAPGCWVRVDAGQIELALTNLVANASEAMRPDGRCTIAVEPLPPGAAGAPQVRLRVTDDGAGMSTDVVNRAFEPFFSTKGRGGGTGLGLAVVHTLVSQSAGEVRILSVEAKGTSVDIVLPRVSAIQRVTPPSGPTSPPPAGITVLLAEDDEGTRTTVARILRYEGYAVIEARDGADAMRLFEEDDGPIHLVITDVMMPGLTGPALAERVSARQPALPVLFMTGFAEQDVAAHLGEVMPNRDLIMKPFSPRDLLARVERLLGASRSEGTVAERR